MTAVFVWLGRREASLTAAHAAAVWVNGVVITFVLNVLLLGMSIGPFLAGVFVMSICAAVGTTIGVNARKRSGRGSVADRAHP